jgi:PAS domain S-box-containing protein
MTVRGALRPHHVDRTIFELGETLIAENDLPSLLKLAADAVVRLIQTDVVAVLGVAPDHLSLRGLVASGTDSSASMRLITEQPDPWSFEAMQSGGAVVVRDLSHDRRFPAPAQGARAMLSGITASIYHGDQPFGVLTGRSWTPSRFTTGQVDVVVDAAELLGRTLTRRASELKLSESEKRFRLLADRSPDALFRTQLYPELRLEYLSPAVESISGYAPAELLDGDRNLAWAVIHPEDRQKAMAFLSDPANIPYPMSMRWIHKSGTVVWTEQAATPIVDEEGRIVAIQGVIRDVTDRILAEQRRQAQAQVRQLILEGRQASEILEAAATHLSRLSGADYGLLARPATTSPGWMLIGANGDGAERRIETPLPEADPLIARITASSSPVLIDDLSKELPADHPLRRLGWAGSALLAPIPGADGLLGVLGIANVAQGRRFSDIGASALGDFASQAALAIEYGQARENLGRLAVLEERARIAAELHDGVIQSLFGAGMVLEGIGEAQGVSPRARNGIARVAKMIDNIMVDVRSYIFDLRPTALAGRDVEEAIRELAQDFEKASSIRCSVDVDGEALRSIEGVGPQLVQIVREALSNVARHAQASHCWLRVHRESNDILVEVRDDGHGFETAQASRGQGLKNIRRRASQISAALEFISHPSSGSAVQVRIPFPTQTTSLSYPPT